MKIHIYFDIISAPMNKEIVNTFVDLYYQNLNTQNYERLSNHLKDSSTFVRDLSEWKGGPSIVNFLQTTSLSYQPIKMNVLINGDRRANVLVSGKVKDDKTQMIVPFTEYILLSFSNQKEYWIHTSILHTIV